jgi:hypothetical protein
MIGIKMKPNIPVHYQKLKNIIFWDRDRQFYWQRKTGVPEENHRSVASH